MARIAALGMALALLAAFEVAPTVSARELTVEVANGGRHMLLLDAARAALGRTPPPSPPKEPAIDQPDEEDLEPLLEAEAPTPKTAARQRIDRVLDGVITVIGPFGDFLGEIAGIAGAVIPAVLD